MYQVKRLEKDTVLEETKVSAGQVKAVGLKVTRRCFAVVDEAGNVVKAKRGQYEIYHTLTSAQEVADWYNS